MDEELEALTLGMLEPSERALLDRLPATFKADVELVLGRWQSDREAISAGVSSAPMSNQVLFR